MRFLRETRIWRFAVLQRIRAEKAYLGNFWFEMFSKFAYNVAFLIFMDQLFKRVGSIAGYSHNDFLLMYLISQVGFYVCYLIIFESMGNLVRMINSGALDLMLLKPVHHRSFLYTMSLRPIDFLTTAVPTIILVSVQINFGILDFSWLSVLAGAFIAVCGIVICNTLLTLLILPAFKTGEATDSLSVFYSISSLSQMPFDNIPGFMKVLSVTVLPQIVISAAAAQVMLQKGDTMGTLILVTCATVVSLVVSHMAWRYAMRQYTSASS